jgi:hypothetical protein
MSLTRASSSNFRAFAVRRAIVGPNHWRGHEKQLKATPRRSLGAGPPPGGRSQTQSGNLFAIWELKKLNSRRGDWSHFLHQRAKGSPVGMAAFLGS